MKKLLLALCLALASLPMASCYDARASPGLSVSVLEAAHAGVTAVGPGYPDHKRITCDTTVGGVEIKPTANNNILSYACKTAGTVFIGAGSTLSASTGVEFTAGQEFGANVKSPERCISAGSVVISCRFLMAVAP
jgi:hypothetical protein